MAQPIHCDDTANPQHPADVMVSQLANGDTTAWCFTHYVDVCRAVIATVEETVAEAAATDQDALARLEAVSAPADQETPPGELPASGEASVDSPFPGDPWPGEAGPEPVQEGLGATETGEEAEGAPESTSGPSGAPGAGVGGQEGSQAEPVQA